jgi:hypothetical protein
MVARFVAFTRTTFESDAIPPGPKDPAYTVRKR